MKIQRNAIYVTTIITCICIAFYTYCTFGWYTENSIAQEQYKGFFTNIVLGVLGSSIVSCIVAIISYLYERKNFMEQYLSTYKKITTHCSNYRKCENTSDKVAWFHNYIHLCDELSNIWSNIGFVFDFRKHRQFLYKVFDFYNDFIILSENDFRLLDEKIHDETKEEIVKMIEKRIYSDKLSNYENINVTYHENKLTQDVELIYRTIFTIYNNSFKSIFRNYKFNNTLVSEDNFAILSESTENYVKQMILLINKYNKTDIKITIPQENYNELSAKGYVSGCTYTNDKEVTSVNCQFILPHYFELKEKMTLAKETVYEEIGFKTINRIKDSIYSSIYSEISFLMLLVIIFSDNFIPNHDTKSDINIVLFFLITALCAIVVHVSKKEHIKSYSEIGFNQKLLIKSATNIGYLNPFLCLIVVLINQECMSFAFQIFLSFLLVLILIFAIISAYNVIKRE